jgi:phosphatidylglycerophosphate synthase
LPDSPPAGEVFRFPAAAPSVPAEGLALLVPDEAARRQAERALWKSLHSASDGWVDRYFNRPVGRLWSKLLIHTPVTANQVSVVSILLGVWSGWWFARGDTASAVTGALLLQLSAILDCTDGDIARVLFKESPLGKWLDLVGDQFVHLAVFAGIPLGLYRQGLEAPWLVLGASAVVGVLVSFGVVLRGWLKPRLRSNHRLQRLIDATTNRDFSVLVLALALGDALEWFVWAAALGVHVFWVSALALQLRSTARA